LIEEITRTFETNTFEEEFEILNKAISTKLSEDQIIVALLKMIKRENNAAINSADINEEFEFKTKKFDRDSSKSARFHLNLGKNFDLVVSDILDFVSSKVRIESREIQDIAILTEFSFFSVPPKYADEIMAKCNFTKLKGKKSRIIDFKEAKKTLKLQEIRQ